jgi:hypothetical protein
MKICSKCKTQKPLENFGFDKTRKDGRNIKCKTCCRLIGKKYREENPDKVKSIRDKFNDLHTEHLKEYRKKYRSENNDKFVVSNKKYRKLNKDKRNQYEVKRKQENPLVKLYSNLQGAIYKSLKGIYVRNKKTEEILGCTLIEFRVYIEKQFEKGMTWDNWGKDTWHLDHKTPKSFATTEQEVYELNHYTNFKPMWAEENLKKGNRFID